MSDWLEGSLHYSVRVVFCLLFYILFDGTVNPEQDWKTRQSPPGEYMFAFNLSSSSSFTSRFPIKNWK